MVLVAGAVDREVLAEEVAALFPQNADYMLVFREGGIKPSLCFGRIGLKPAVPETIREVEKAVADLRAQSSREPLALGAYELHITEQSAPAEMNLDAKRLSLMLNSFLFNNLSFFNYIEDVMYTKLKSSGLSNFAAGVPDHDAFAKLIRDRFGVEADIQQLSDADEDVSSICRSPQIPLDSTPGFKIRVLHALGKGQVIELLKPHAPDLAKGLLQGGENDVPGYRYVFPLRCKSRAVIRTNEFMVAEPSDSLRLSLLTIFCINQWVEEYAYTRTRRGQQSCLYWQTDSITKLIENVDNSRMDFGEMFLTYMAELAELVIASTQGHSFAYLSYEAADDALTRVFATFKPAAGEGIENEEAPPPVLLKDFREYVSAYLFQTQAGGHEREIYIRSIGNRKEYADLGLQTVRCRRNQMIDEGLARGSKTQSEAAFIIHDQGVPVGVICVECPYKDGLKNDIDFLRQVANNASIYRSFLFRVGDQRWLRRNLKLQDVSHELEKLQLVITDQGPRDRLAQITMELDIQSFADEKAEEEAASFEDRINRLVREEAGGSEALLKDLAEPVKVFNPPRHKVPLAIQMAAIHIVRILLHNRVHAVDPHPIQVVTRDAHAGVRNALLIKTILDLNLPEREVQQAFRQPIRRTDRDHVGLYMIGVIVRTWGGRLDFDRRPGVTTRKLEICIPFDRPGAQGEGDADTRNSDFALRI